ncbi:unnamed protein product [Closterium sp. Naga37s-1]|nr:unnamed protein product [Closterium sp. Naga37s-1]
MEDTKSPDGSPPVMESEIPPSAAPDAAAAAAAAAATAAAAPAVPTVTPAAPPPAPPAAPPAAATSPSTPADVAATAVPGPVNLADELAVARACDTWHALLGRLRSLDRDCEDKAVEGPAVAAPLGEISAGETAPGGGAVGEAVKGAAAVGAAATGRKQCLLEEAVDWCIDSLSRWDYNETRGEESDDGAMEVDGAGGMTDMGDRGNVGGGGDKGGGGDVALGGASEDEAVRDGAGGENANENANAMGRLLRGEATAELERLVSRLLGDRRHGERERRGGRGSGEEGEGREVGEVGAGSAVERGGMGGRQCAGVVRVVALLEECLLMAHSHYAAAAAAVEVTTSAVAAVPAASPAAVAASALASAAGGAVQSSRGCRQLVERLVCRVLGVSVCAHTQREGQGGETGGACACFIRNSGAEGELQERKEGKEGVERRSEGSEGLQDVGVGMDWLVVLVGGKAEFTDAVLGALIHTCTYSSTYTHPCVSPWECKECKGMHACAGACERRQPGAAAAVDGDTVMEGAESGQEGRHRSQEGQEGQEEQAGPEGQEGQGGKEGKEGVGMGWAAFLHLAVGSVCLAPNVLLALSSSTPSSSPPTSSSSPPASSNESRTTYQLSVSHKFSTTHQSATTNEHSSASPLQRLLSSPPATLLRLWRCCCHGDGVGVNAGMGIDGGAETRGARGVGVEGQHSGKTDGCCGLQDYLPPPPCVCITDTVTSGVKELTRLAMDGAGQATQPGGSTAGAGAAEEGSAAGAAAAAAGVWGEEVGALLGDYCAELTAAVVKCCIEVIDAHVALAGRETRGSNTSSSIGGGGSRLVLLEGWLDARVVECHMGEGQGFLAAAASAAAAAGGMHGVNARRVLGNRKAAMSGTGLMEMTGRMGKMARLGAPGGSTGVRFVEGNGDGMVSAGRGALAALQLMHVVVAAVVPPSFRWVPGDSERMLQQGHLMALQRQEEERGGGGGGGGGGVKSEGVVGGEGGAGCNPRLALLHDVEVAPRLEVPPTAAAVAAAVVEEEWGRRGDELRCVAELAAVVGSMGGTCCHHFTQLVHESTHFVASLANAHASLPLSPAPPSANPLRRRSHSHGRAARGVRTAAGGEGVRAAGAERMGRAGRSLLEENRALMSLLAPAPPAHRLFPPMLSATPTPPPPPAPHCTPSHTSPTSGELHWVVEGKPSPSPLHATPAVLAPTPAQRISTATAAASPAASMRTPAATARVGGAAAYAGDSLLQHSQQQQQREVMVERVCVELRAVISLAASTMDGQRNTTARGRGSSSAGAVEDSGVLSEDAALAASVAEAVAAAEGRASGSAGIMCAALAAIADLPHELPLTSQQYLEASVGGGGRGGIELIESATQEESALSILVHLFSPLFSPSPLLAAAAEALQQQARMVAWVHASVGEEVVRALLADAISHATVAANNASSPLTMPARVRTPAPASLPSRPSSPATPRATSTSTTTTTATTGTTTASSIPSQPPFSNPPSSASSSPPCSPPWLHRLPALSSYMHAAAWLPTPLACAASLAHLLSPRDLADLLLLLWHCMDYAIAAGPLFAFSPWKTAAAGSAAAPPPPLAPTVAAAAGSDGATAGKFGAPKLILHPPSKAGVGGSAAPVTQDTTASNSTAPAASALLQALLQQQQKQQPQEPLLALPLASPRFPFLPLPSPPFLHHSPLNSSPNNPPFLFPLVRAHHAHHVHLQAAAGRAVPPWRGVLLTLVRRNIATLGPFARQLLLDEG